MARQVIDRYKRGLFVTGYSDYFDTLFYAKLSILNFLFVWCEYG